VSSDHPIASIAHYNLLEAIGEGGIGATYRARDARVGRTVALKLIAPSISADPDRLSRLMTDARAAMALSHPNIATLFDVGEEGDRAYLVYEFAAGANLRDELAGGAMNARRAFDLAMQMADAVADAHAHGIVHGDLRPGTVIVTAKGSAKILDYGLAAWTRGGLLRAQAGRDPDTLPADATDVVAYLSPEQAFGSATDVRTDVFSLAVLTYEMATGRNPFVGATPAETVINVLQRRVTPPSQVNPSLPPELDEILARALARNLAERQQSVAAFAAELRGAASVLDVPGSDAVSPSILLPLDERPDKEATGLLYGGLTAAAAAAGLVWWWLSRR
jgi:eukaryotic-like serine/threonine-protein kinase